MARGYKKKHRGIPSDGRYHYKGFAGNANLSGMFETTTDLMFNIQVPVVVNNGIYSFLGNQERFRVQAGMRLTDYQQQQPQQQPQQYEPHVNTISQFDMHVQMTPPLNPQINIPIQQIHINLIGTKTKPSNGFCYCATFFFGSICIFPLCFMCCMWWKKIIYPLYELTTQAYQDIATFVQRNPGPKILNLTIVDNGFNAQKAKILYDTLSRSTISVFIFSNEALGCNGEYNEADDFRNNMQPIKSLSITSSITWGQMIL